MEVISRKEAKAAGLTRYFTGKPCKNNHISERYVSKRSCISCELDWYSKNKDTVKKVNDTKWRNLNKNRKKVSQRVYSQKNKQLINAKNRTRKASQKQRVPKWADIGKIKEIYKNCPKGHHVDHIVPLQGEFVSGLHVENNLQYLTIQENLSKGNRYENKCNERRYSDI
jgi:hypothetical protein